MHAPVSTTGPTMPYATSLPILLLDLGSLSTDQEHPGVRLQSPPDRLGPEERSRPDRELPCHQDFPLKHCHCPVKETWTGRATLEPCLAQRPGDALRTLSGQGALSGAMSGMDANRENEPICQGASTPMQAKVNTVGRSLGMRELAAAGLLCMKMHAACPCRMMRRVLGY